MIVSREILKSAETSLISRETNSNYSYQHRLLTNRKEQIVMTIRKELEECDEFLISVAFITESGLILLLEQLRILEKRGIKGKILTGDYLNFSQPKALSRLLEFKNIKLRLLKGENLHAKGFFFRKNNVWSLIIGSSNLTQNALTTNHEWNFKITSLDKGKIVKEILEEFNYLYNSLEPLTEYEVSEYNELYEAFREKRYLPMGNRDSRTNNKKIIKPNFMQQEALLNIELLRKQGKEKALLISATGTGKTFLTAFDVKKVKPKKMLFLAHRKNILTKAKQTFETIIPHTKMEIYEANSDLNSNYFFCMVQTLNKDEHLKKFSPDFFDYIVVDEVHHGGASTYQKIMDYFKPKFLLGMTATPERNDEFDIYELFNHTIAYEIRLHDALNENLLCPFHYFGISDIFVDGKEISKTSTINDLVSEERIRHIVEKIKYYGFSGPVVKGLIFVSGRLEGKLLSEALNNYNFRTKFLSGDDSESIRENSIEELEEGELDYIITVDIFNEGIDIPCINQVVLLRETDSSIVYIQQLGRGLRKYVDKEFVVILDFIGNYDKNFLVPIAISQNNSYDKDFMKRFITGGTDLIPGQSSVVFDEIVKETIFKNINNTNFSTKKNIQENFNLLKKQLGRTPYLNDFFTKNMIEPSVVLKYKGNYDEVLSILDKDYNSYSKKMSENEKNYLNFISKFFTPGKRVHEFEILKYLIENDFIDEDRIKKILETKHDLYDQEDNIKNAFSHLMKTIFTSFSTIKSYLPLVEKGEKNTYLLKKDFKESLNKNKYFETLILDLLEYNFNYIEKNYKQLSQKAITLFKSYTKEEAHRYLNLDFNNGLQVSGYNIFDESKIVTVFITLDSSSSFTSYDNKILNSKTLTWFSKNNRDLERKGKITKEGLIANNYYNIQIFLKKTNSENFYYLGKVKNVKEATKTKKSDETYLVKYVLEMENEIEPHLYEYLISEEKFI